MPPRERLDRLLVLRGLAESGARARALVLAGEVLVGGRPAEKPGAAVDPAAEIRLRERGPAGRYASRGGLKLEAALRRFGIDCAGRAALDLGASTGGFTDCLLQHGCRLVVAADVGRGLLDWRLRQDPRVVLRERLNARHLQPEDLPVRPDLVTADLSFISLEKVLPRVVECLPGAEIVALVKPQFEVGRGLVGKGGVVRDPAMHREVLLRLGRSLAAACGLGLRGVMRSPITGPRGNREFFLHLAGEPPGLAGEALAAAVEKALAGSEEPAREEI